MTLISLWRQYRKEVQYLLLFFLLVRIFTDINAQYLPFEDALLDVKFKLRGSEQSDSSIVVIYADNQDLEFLGGYPIPRVFFATLIHALHEAGSSVIGFDIVFEKPNPMYPEYDTLLVEAVRSAGNVVFAQYAREQDVIEQKGALYLRRDDPVRSFDALYAATTSHGYSNISAQAPIRTIPIAYPMEISTTGEAAPAELKPSFLMHLVSYAMQARKSASVSITKRSPFYGYTSVYPFMQSINYAGDRTKYRTYPLVTFLKAYDSLAQGYEVTFPFASLKNTSVIVAIIAEGRSRFVQTPLDDAFPVSLLHAAALDTIFQHKEIVYIHRSLMVGLSALFTFPFFFGLKKWRWGGSIAFIVILLLFFLFNQISFSFLRLHIPVLPGMLFILSGYVFRILRERKIRHRIDSELQTRLASLQRQLEIKQAEVEQVKIQLDSDAMHADELHRLREKISEAEREIQALRKNIDEEEVKEGAVDMPEGAIEFERTVYAPTSPMKKIVEQIQSVAAQEVTVVLYGDSGTGKELAARAIHARSARKDKPFIAVNCGALSETLLESELFGYEKGAFTGAQKTQTGRFERASGGTLFLDEIGETSEAFQIKLLRVLQEGEIERVGGTEIIKVDVRVVAATNKELKKLVAEKKFREDLYYRLHVFPITLPPLRERKMDIPYLTQYVLQKSGSSLSLSSVALDALMHYEWRGNIRELESVLTRATLLAMNASRSMITLADLSEEIILASRKRIDLGQMILEGLRKKDFARGAIHSISEELGGLDRSTTTEYFRGMIFQQYVRAAFDLRKTVAQIADRESEDDTFTRVSKKVNEYLTSVEKEIDRSKSIEENCASAHARYKNLPQRFHDALEEIVRQYYGK